jgi:Ser/Thr protein kinase RdoA (MazF antagonist)
MAFLPTVAGADAAPELVASWAEDRPGGPAGFVSPFYPGGDLHFGDPIPEAVVTTLARLHVAGAAAAIDWTWRFDAAKVDRLRDNALQALSTTERFLQRFADPAAWRARLAHTSASPALRQAAETLPRTLTHGDMHPGNLLRRADGSAVIVDWGAACLAPAMLDLANIVEIGSPLWEAYVRAYRAAGGAFDEAIARRGFWWARAMTAVMYIPWAAANSDRVTDLIEQAEAATAELTALI